MRLQGQLTKKLCLIGVISVLLTSISCGVAFWFVFSDEAKNDLENYGSVASQCVDNTGTYDELGKLVCDGYRLTVISVTGDVAYESDNSIAVDNMENHLERPEVQQAILKGSGESSRDSKTTNTRVFYYAQKLQNGDILRVSKQVNSVFSVFNVIIPIIVAIAIYVLLVCVFLASEFTKSLVKPIKEMAKDVDNVGYEELIPLAETIEMQKNEISQQVDKIQEEKDKINAIIANMEEGLILLDTQKNILMDNDSAQVLLELKGKSVIGKNIEMLCANSELLDCINSASKGKSKDAETKVGSEALQVLVNPVYSAKEQTGIICLIMNITDRNRTEKLRREFTANVSHELKTPLTSISGYAEMIENDMVKDDDIRHFAGRIHREAGRLVSLISDIIKLSKLDDEQAIGEKQSVNLLDIVNESVETLELSAEKNNIQLISNGESCYVRGDNTGLYELVYNLCDNAIRYNKPNGKVFIELHKNGNKAELSVRDTGIGIDKKHLSRVFERFYRVDKSRSKETGGTGLGLAIVKHIAEQHNAQISIDSEEGKGTNITVIFNLT
ncbi:MAG TPA: PAS domain-containing protein [Clostridiales bacterium]|nr:PAS domain-containing protein [Clostridiales bacterium]